MNIENVQKLINLSKDLSDYARCMKMATKYTCENEFNFNYYSLILIRVREESRELSRKFNLVDKETGEIFEL